MQKVTRAKDLQRFYSILQVLEDRLGGKKTLSDCCGSSLFPARGVYFFFEGGEVRSHTGEGPRVTRVGTHALKRDSKATLWNRLSQHRGVKRSGGGNHRGSIFRLLVGKALILRDNLHIPSWGVGSDPGKAAKRLGMDSNALLMAEAPIEKTVSDYICRMPFLWIIIDDNPGPESRRGFIERNTIALLSNYEKLPLEPASDDWLGHSSDREKVRNSGLWNNNHVEETYDPAFLGDLEWQVKRIAVKTEG